MLLGNGHLPLLSREHRDSALEGHGMWREKLFASDAHGRPRQPTSTQPAVNRVVELSAKVEI